MSDEQESSVRDEPVYLQEVVKSLKNGLINEYDEGSWGLDIEDDPTFEDMLPHTDNEAVVRMNIGKQTFLITIKEITDGPETVG